jgi:hypothetical protein
MDHRCRIVLPCGVATTCLVSEVENNFFKTFIAYFSHFLTLKNGLEVGLASVIGVYIVD